MKIRNRLVAFLCMSFMAAGVAVGISINRDSYTRIEAYDNHDADTYYSGISDSLTGNQLLGALRSLNGSKRKKTIGYKNLADYYKYTDYDADSMTIGSDGQPQSGKLVAFYSGQVQNGMSGMNKEHVWPDSRGGNLVEADIHMARPTLTKDNSGRGNSFYVENSNSTTSGWDPKFALNSDIRYRGDSARIVFYCTVANSQLSLIDETNDSTGNRTMGKLYDLIKWHLEYAPLQREMNRNEGAEFLQGNRNPFIDHPEYVCRIWGNTNENTKRLCASDPYAASAPTSITLSDSSVEIVVGRTKTISVASVTPSDASKGVRWESSDTSVATISNTGVISAVALGRTTITATSSFDSSVKATCSVTVVNPSPVAMTGINASVGQETIFQNDTTQIHVTALPDTVYPAPTYTYSVDVENVVSISNTGLVTGLNPGSAIITVTATQGDVVKTTQVLVNVEEKGTVEGSITVTKDSCTATSGYGWANWSQGGVNGEAFIYGANSEGLLQFNSKQTNKSLANTSELPGDLISIKATGAKGDKLWALYGSSSPITREAVSGTTELGEKTVTAEGTTWNISVTGLRYFSLIYKDSGAAYLSSVEINYGGAGGGGETTKALHSLRIASAPTKVNYQVGETLDLTGLQVKAVYSDQTEADVTSQVTTNISGQLNDAGTFSVIVSYTESGVKRSATFSITVTSQGGDPTPSPAKKGCGGSIATTSIILSAISMLGIALILVKKSKKRGI